jgi:hypothetical protein
MVVAEFAGGQVKVGARLSVRAVTAGYAASRLLTR